MKIEDAFKFIFNRENLNSKKRFNQNYIDKFNQNFERKYKNLIKDVSPKIKKYNNVYVDFNLYVKENQDYILTNEEVELRNSFSEGYKVRLWNGKRFVERDNDSLDNINIVFRDVTKKILKSTNLESLNVDKKNVKRTFYNEKPYIHKDILTQEDKIRILRNISKKINNISDKIIMTKIIYREINDQNLFLNKYKELSQNIFITIAHVFIIVKSEDGNSKSYHFGTSAIGLEIFHKLDKKIKNLKEIIDGLVISKNLKGGEYEVILNPHLSGILAHESFGHGMEADTILRGRAKAGDMLGKKIANENVSIIDEPNIEGKHGMFFFDDEGNITSKTYLVKNGIINEPISDLFSKSMLNLKRSNNGRAENFSHKVYSRMSNTYFKRGETKKEDLFSKVKDGIYIISTSGGMEDPKNWSVQIQGCFGQRIKNGKLVNEFYNDFTITGYLPDILKNIKGISKEFKIEGVGRCGKGHKEWVRVSDGGPYLHIKKMRLG